jgi:putative aldouronate transport system permease protein
MGNKIHESAPRKLFNGLNFLILVFLALICLVPFIHVIAVSFSNKAYVQAGLVTFWPINPNLASYKYLLTRAAFWNAFNYSVFRLAFGTAINMFLITLAAYPLSKGVHKFRMRTFYAWFFFITMLVNGGLIPNYILVAQLGLRDTIWSLVLPQALPIFNLVLMLNFFRQVPDELEEASYIDGASHLRTLFQIYIPVSVPAIATITLFCMVWHWNMWFDGMIYMTSPEKRPLQTYLRTVIIDLDMQEMSGDDWELLQLLADRAIRSAQIIIAVIPILCVYPFLQRYFVKGIVLGSVKG